MAEFMPIREQKVYKDRRESRDVDYRMLYRFDRVNVEWMSAHFLGDSFETRGGALTNEERFRVFLRYVGDPGFQSGVGEDVGIDRSTVSKTIYSVMNAIVAKSNQWIKFPSTLEELQLEQLNWGTKYNFPSAIGAIDCTHIPILKPSVHGDEYINRKRFASMNVQATCNASEEFTSVDASWPGSVHDARIWKNSDIYRVLQWNGARGLILGDSGYGISPWLMTPYSVPDTPQKISYNRLFTRERVIIERCFGQLKQRFPILHHKMRVKLDRVPSLVLSCFILHNVAKKLNDEEFDVVQEERNDDDRVEHDDQYNEVLIRRRGQQRRDVIANIIHGL